MMTLLVESVPLVVGSQVSQADVEMAGLIVDLAVGLALLSCLRRSASKILLALNHQNTSDTMKIRWAYGPESTRNTYSMTI